MSHRQPPSPVLEFRRRRGWSQTQLAERAGISRTAVSAIEQGRLSPSVHAALALAAALETTVERLFGSPSPDRAESVAWAFPPPEGACRYWEAEVAGRHWRFPVESTGIGEIPQDGTWDGRASHPRETSDPRRVLVVATCDPAVGLLAAEYSRQTPYSLLPLTRSSREGLLLLREGKIHAAGVHLSSNRHAGGNASIVREICGGNVQLLRIGVWQEGIVFATHLGLRSAQAAVQTRLRWVGREAGSGARQCLDELLAGRTPPRRVAPDHRAVALAIRCGWADAGVCLRLAGEEAGLGFLALRREPYDFCFPQQLAGDPRLDALLDVVRSPRYRRLLDDLPGYDTRSTGEVASC